MGVPGLLCCITLSLEHRGAVPWAVSSSLSEDKTAEYNIYTQELPEEDEIKPGNTNINTIIC